MGGPIKSKSAAEVCRLLLDVMYRYGPPRIIQTDNGKEFNNASLTEVVEEMRILKINGRPYHPQSQGRVERLNQTLSNFLRRKLQEDSEWPSQLQYFYYSYNNRVHRSLPGGKTPFELFMKRPNFSLFQEQNHCQLTKEERQFLDEAPLDVEDDLEEDADPQEGEDVQPEQVDTAYPIELDWPAPESSSSSATGSDSLTELLIDAPVYFYHAPNLDGARGLAALKVGWEAGLISRVVPIDESNGFRLFEVKDLKGVCWGKFSKRQIRLRCVEEDIEDDDDPGSSRQHHADDEPGSSRQHHGDDERDDDENGSRRGKRRFQPYRKK